ncbi:MAG: YceI family protein [Bdellovibrionota bacterium]
MNSYRQSQPSNSSLSAHLAVAGRILTLLFFCTTPVAAFADTFEHQLDKSQSRCHFELKGNLIDLNGKFNAYNGVVSFDSTNRKPLQVALKADISDVTVARTDSLGSLEALSPEALFRAIPNPIVAFNSTSITPISSNLYQVNGVLRRGNKEWNASFRANFALQSAVRSMVSAKVSGPVLNFASQLPFKVANGNDEGMVDCQLTFVPAQSLSSQKPQTQHK